MNNNDLDIKAIRKKLKLTQADFAKRIGVDTKTVQNWEYGRPIPTTKHGIIRNLIEQSEATIKEQHFYGGDQYNQNGDNIKGEHVTVESSDIEKFLDAIKGAQAISQKSQEQIDRLIAVIERLTAKE